MSYTELQTGKVKKIGIMSPNEVEKYCQNLCKEISPKKYKDVITNGFKSYENSWLEVLNDELWKSEEYHKDFIVYKNDILYRVYDVKNHEDGDFFFHKEKISDDEFRFITQYYNGGTCLSEILEEETDKIVDKL